MADGLLDFIKTPEGQGLLSTVFGGLAGAQRNAPLNSIGRAGMSGLMGYGNALEQQAQLAEKDQAKKLRDMQISQMQQQVNDAQAMRDLAKASYIPGVSASSNALAAGAALGKAGPTNAAAALLPVSTDTPASFDMKAYMNGLMRIDPLKAIELQQNARKANEVTLREGEQVFDRTTGKVIYGTPPAQDLTFVPGDGYRPDYMVDKKRGIVPIQTANGATYAGVQPSANPVAIPPASGQPATVLPAPTSPMVPVAPGLPEDKNAPWRGMPARQADEMRKSVYDQESKKLDELRASVTKGQKTLASLDRFGELNRGTATGGLLDKFLPDFMTLDNGKQEMLSIQDALAPTMRAPGSGSSSDTDVRMMKSGLPGINKEGNVNRDIRNRYATMLDSDRNELTFKEKYLAQYGHLNGADAAYRESLNTKNSPAATPVLTPNAKMLNSEQRAALDIIIKSGDKNLIDNARAKGWIK